TLADVVSAGHAGAVFQHRDGAMGPAAEQREHREQNRHFPPNRTVTPLGTNCGFGSWAVPIQSSANRLQSRLQVESCSCVLSAEIVLPLARSTSITYSSRACTTPRQRVPPTPEETLKRPQ